MWTRAAFAKHYVPGLFAMAVDTYENKRQTSMWQNLCTIGNSVKSYEENALRSGLDTLRDKAEGATVTFDTQIPGAKQTWVHSVKALGVRLTEEAIEDCLYELKGGGEGKFKEMFADLGAAAEETLEVNIARFFNSGTATTYHTTRDSKALFASDHPKLDGTTFSNLATYADLTYTAFWANIVAAENQTNHRGYKIGKKVMDLWVPPQLERNGLEILKSTDRPDTGNRAINAYSASGRNIKLRVWPHMSDADAWIFKLDGRGIRFFWRRKTRFGKNPDFLTGDMMVKVDQRWSAEIDDAQSFYGNIPA